MSTSLKPEHLEAINERRGFMTPALIGTTTRGGTYIIATNGALESNGQSRDLVAVVPTLAGWAAVALRPTVNPELIAEIEAALS